MSAANMRLSLYASDSHPSPLDLEWAKFADGNARQFRLRQPKVAYHRIPGEVGQLRGIGGIVLVAVLGVMESEAVQVARLDPFLNRPCPFGDATVEGWANQCNHAVIRPVVNREFHQWTLKEVEQWVMNGIIHSDKESREISVPRIGGFSPEQRRAIAAAATKEERRLAYAIAQGGSRGLKKCPKSFLAGCALCKGVGKVALEVAA